MAFLLTRQVLSGLLIIAAGSAETGLLVLNRYLLLKGVFKFPYPITVTVIQCLITYICVLAAEYPFRLLLALINPPKIVLRPEVDKQAQPYRYEPPRTSPTRFLRAFSPRRFAFRRPSTEPSPIKLLRKASPLAIVFMLKISLGNVFMTHLTIPAYTLLRIGAIPLAFAFNALSKGESYTALASLWAILAVSSLFLAVLPLTENIALGDLVLGASLSVIDALLPITVLRMCQEKCDAFPPDADPEDSIESRDVAASYLYRLGQGSSPFWPVLRHASLLSTVFLVPLVFLTGEAKHIWNNSYVLDTTCVRQLFLFSGVLNGTFLVIMSLLVMAASPVTSSFLTAFSNAIQIGAFCKSSMDVYSWSGLAGCWFFSVCFIVAQIFAQWRGEKTAEVTPARNTIPILRTVTTILFLCLGVSGVARISLNYVKAPPLEGPGCQMRESLVTELTLSQDFKFNSTAHDDYLGARPDVDTTADLPLMLERCAEVDSGRGVDDVINCLKFLAHESDKYLTLPTAGSGDRASERIAQNTVFDNNESQTGMPTHHVTLSEAAPASKSSTGTCPGPIFPYHVYWTGPASWRLELFVKAYLYTQNLPCSRLWIWLDSDMDANAVERMLCDDPIFRRFLPLISRGDIVIKAWNFPERIPLPKISINHTTSFHPRLRDDKLEVPVTDNIIQDTTGNWLHFSSSLAHFTPVQVSDAVRFVVLHLHGGVYLDMDVMLLRDMRPLLLQPHSFAEQWVERCPIPDFNTAVLSVPANSSLSTYLVHGGVRMGMNFHPKVIGRMMLGDGRIEELAMLQNAVFDPLVTDVRRKRTENCTVPCHKNFEQVFRAEVEEGEREWSAYNGSDGGERTLDKFFRGAFAYHIHNQWQKFPEPTSWMDVITTAQDGFFEGSRTNVYGEMWEGPRILEYDRDTWPGF